MEDADPFECQSTHGHLVRFSFGTLLFIERAGPEGMADGLASPFDESLAQEFGAAKPAMDPALVTATFGNGRDAGVFLQVLGVGVTGALFAEPSQESGGVDGAGTREIGEDCKVFM